MSAINTSWQPDPLGIPKLNVPEVKYVGSFDENNLLTNEGSYKWTTDQWEHLHNGKYFTDCLHGNGNYKWDRKFSDVTTYDGTLYANNIEGYGTFSYPDESLFEGLFKGNKRFGPGVFTHYDGRQDVGMWDSQQLMRLCGTLRPEYVPRLTKTPFGKARASRYKKLVPVNNKVDDIATSILTELGADEEVLQQAELLYSRSARNPKSLFFNKRAYDKDFFGNVEEYCIDVALSEEELNNVLQTEDNVNDLPKLGSKIENNSIKSHTKKVAVTDLVAWNNGKLSTEMLRHTFLHRNSEERLQGIIKKLLAGERNSFRQPGPHELACITFLCQCSDGMDKPLFDILNKFNVNPNVSDAKGNTGIIFATSRDRHAVIRALNQTGADFDSVNDEGMTALQIALLRYIAVKNSVTNWETAFLPPVEVPNPSKRILIKEWNPHNSFTDTDDNSPFYKLATCERSVINIMADSRPSWYSTGFRSNLEIINTECKSPSLSSQQNGDTGQSAMNFTFSQEKFEIKPNDEQQYIFKLDQKLPPKTKKRVKKNQKSKMKETIERINSGLEKTTEGTLNVIASTILLLLRKGARASYGEVPFSPLTLGMFTQRPEIIEALLKNGADPNVRTPQEDGYLTPLHLLTSFNTFPKMDTIAEILLKYGADPNLRTNSDHWDYLKKTIGGINYEDDGLGKTPLHMLCMRPDMDDDVGGVLTKLAKLLLENKADPNLLHLGHTPLSIATLKGNRYLVKELLETERVDPNQKLGAGYGVPLTLLLHENNLDALPVGQGILMLNTLVEHGANPLNPVSDKQNAVEYVRNRIAERKANAPRPETGKKKKKKGKMSLDKVQEKLLSHLDELKSRALVKNFEGKVLKQMYNLINTPNEEAGLEAMKQHAEILNFEKAVHIFKRLGDAGYPLKPEKVVGVLEHVLELEFAKLPSKRERRRSSVPEADNVETGEAIPEYDVTTLAGYLCVPRPRRSSSLVQISYPEADPDQESYDMCFECHERHDDAVLISCPRCGMVKLCSEACNIKNVEANGVHKCPDIFYNKERERLEAQMGVTKKKKEKKGKLRKTDRSKERGKTGKASKTGKTGKTGKAGQDEGKFGRTGKTSKTGKTGKTGKTAQEEGKIGQTGKASKTGKTGKTNGLGLHKNAGKIFSQKYLEYMMQVSGSGYTLDLDKLFFPYCAYVDGNVYYRIFGDSPIFKENYSIV